MTAGVQTLRHEAWRKTVHLATCVLPVWIYFAPAAWRLRGLLLALLLGLGIDALRLAWRPFGSRFEAVIGTYLREDERRGLVLGAHYVTLSAVLLGASVAPAIGALSLGYLVVGDAAAALVGRAVGKRRFWGKSLEGSLACFACCFGLGLWVLQGRPLVALAGACVATVVEALPLPIDDNLSVPLLSAAVLVALV